MQPTKQPDNTLMNKHAKQVAEAYGQIRDAVRATEKVTMAEVIAILELVKAELVREVQSQIDKA